MTKFLQSIINILGENMKAIVFDFDGTLTKSRKESNCWYEVWKYMDDLAYDDFLYKKYKNNEIDDIEWFDLIFKRYKEKGVKREYLHEISKKIELLPGAHETLKYLYDNDVKIFILSGGIRQIIEDILKRENVYNFITSIETYDLIFDNEGNLIDFKQPNFHNPENKNEYIDLLTKQYNLKSDEILFVGNGANDEKVYLSGANTLCINPDDADISNKVVWHNAIENCGNLVEILKFCDIKDMKNIKKGL